MPKKMIKTCTEISLAVSRRSFLGISAGLVLYPTLALLGGQAGAEERVGNFGPQQDAALPFTITFKEITQLNGTPPALHSHQVASTDSDDWLLIGGRGGPAELIMGQKTPQISQTGLHGFNPPAAKVDNFPRKSYNTNLWVYNPTTGAVVSFDTEQLPVDLARPLQATSQQSWFDRDTDTLTLIGGYGWNADLTDMVTFDTMIQVNVSDLVAAIKAGVSADQVSGLFQMTSDPLLQVTGGDLIKSGNDFFLVMGQKFMGQYFAFGVGVPGGATQEYTEEVRQITMVPGAFKILNIAQLSQPDRAELHRRDLNVEITIDATTGQPLIGIYGGVFKGGGPLGFEKPILFEPSNGSFSVQDTGVQLFNGYATSVVPIWSDTDQIMSQVFFGGIGHGVYNLHDEPSGLDNDGMPFGSDISVLTHSKDGSWAEYVLMDPTPGNQLVGANSSFVPKPSLRTSGTFQHENVLMLDALPADGPVLIGWIYGGIWAEMPQPPKHVAQGDEVPTHATNQIFEVYVSRTPGSAIPVLP